jgi:hypothetical protein
MAAVQDLQREHGSSWAGVPAKAKQQMIAERVGTLCVAKGGLGKGKGEGRGRGRGKGKGGGVGGSGWAGGRGGGTGAGR